MDDNAKELHKRGERLFEKKKPIDGLNQEIALQCYPERADFTQPHQWGAETATHLFNSAPSLARRDLCNMFGSILRPRSQQWFKATIGDEDLMQQQPVQKLCDAITKTMRRHIYRHGAQFGRATKEADHDYGTFGDAVLFAGLSRNHDGLLFRDFHLRDCAWVEGPDGEISEGGALWRKFKMSARNMRAEYPKATLHQSVIDALDKDPDREFTLCHVMMPADEYYSDRKRGRGLAPMPWASVYYDHDNCMMLREDASHEFRYVVPRWQTISGSPYAISPAALTALPDARGLQIMAQVLLEAGEKTVDPPMKAARGAIIGDVNLYSGGITWFDKEYDDKAGSVLEPILLGKQIGIGVDLLMLAKESIKDCWFLNKLSMPPPQSGRTATEVVQLTEEYVRANVPLFEPIETSYNAPLLDLIAATLMRYGAFGDLRSMPRELWGRDLQFEFSNPLQDAIERNKANQAQIVFGVAAGLEPIDPSAKHVIDAPRLLRDVMTGSGGPAVWQRSEEEVEAMKAAEAQAGQIVAGLGAAQQAADVVDTGASAAAQLQQVFGQMPEAA